MARSKHRKAHKEALHLRKLDHELARRWAQAGQPKNVGKGRWQVQPDEGHEGMQRIGLNGQFIEDGDVIEVKGMAQHKDGRYIVGMDPGLPGAERTVIHHRGDDTIIMDSVPKRGHGGFERFIKALVDGEEVPATANRNGDVYLNVAPPEGSEVQIIGNYVGHEDQKNRFLSMGCIADPAPLIRGRSANFLSIDDAAHFENVPEMEGLDGPLLPGICGPFEGVARLVSLTPRAQEFRDRCEAEGVTAYVSFGEPRPLRGPSRPIFCMDEAIVGLLKSGEPGMMLRPDTCSICGAIWPTCEHATNPGAHLEIGWHRDPVTGEPVFDEVSLCPGPDPHGITDLKEPS